MQSKFHRFLIKNRFTYHQSASCGCHNKYVLQSNYNVVVQKTSCMNGTRHATCPVNWIIWNNGNKVAEGLERTFKEFGHAKKWMEDNGVILNRTTIP